MSDISVRKDGKGSAYIISHKRCGVTECLFVTLQELGELKEQIEKL